MTYSIIIPQVRQEIEKIVAWKAKSYPPQLPYIVYCAS